MRKISISNTRGFSLIEILLVIGIVFAMMIFKVQEINDSNMAKLSNVFSDQMKAVSNAVNAYINLNYSNLSTLKNIQDGKIYGPLNCNSSTNSCTITIKTLKNSYLLNNNFNETTILGNDYSIQLNRTGVSPNFMINGLIISNGENKRNGEVNKIFLGNVIRDIGGDAGLMKNKGSMAGIYGGWSTNNLTYDILNDKKDYIGVQVGYNANMYSIYLRRDGTLSMTGELNMDRNNISNIQDFNAYGNGLINGTLNIGKDITIEGNQKIKGTISSEGEIYASGNITSNALVSGQYLQPTSFANIGEACQNLGYISKDKFGKILSCKSGFWRSVSDFPAGSPIPWPSNNLPQGWLICNGQSFNKTLYPELAKVYHTGFLPDLRGVFIRGNDNGRGLDKDRNLGSYQEDSMQKITGSFPVANRYRGYFNGSFRTIGNWNTNYKNGGSDDWGKQVEFDSSYTTRTAEETRPKNITFNYIVKAE